MPDSPLPNPPNNSSPESRVTLQVGGDVKVAGDVAGRDLSKTINDIINIFTGSKRDSLERRNRRVMLEKVRNFWVKGVLEQSLHGAALIELGMEYKPEAVQYPWSTVLQRPDQPAQSLPSGTKTVEVFDQVNGELLILGAPGSGKTTMLLDLARDLIARADQDETLPIPVVFNLSSWAEKRPLLAEWLVDELRFRYDVPKKIATSWVKDDYVLPLLDGLDEVKLEQRAACVEAINHFRKEHGLLPTVVCSRIADYEALNAQLRLRGAIVLQPLTHEQIDGYLASAGEQLASVRALLQRDVGLQELAESPLILSIMALAYRGTTVESLPELTTIEVQRKHLFDNYVQRMFERRGIDKRYTQKQTIQWLNWLTQRMVEHSQTTFYLERMQPSWLPTSTQRWLATTGIGVVITGFVGLLVAWGGGLPIRLGASPLIGYIFEIGIGLSAGLAVYLAIKRAFRFIDCLFVGSVFGLAFGATFGLEYEQLSIGLSIGLFIGLCTGTMFGLVGRRMASASLEKIEIIETLNWSWSKALPGSATGFIGGFVSGLVMAQPIHMANPSRFGFALGLAIGLGTGLVTGLTGGEIEMKTAPNQGIRQSARNAILIGLITSMSAGLPIGVAGMASWLGSNPLNFGVSMGLSIGFASGIATGLFYGGLAVVQHIALRFMLYYKGAIPLNLVHFLDYCAERIFLRKVGGGYIFVHRLLMEYFAGVESLNH